jgi:hypothetical protein
MRECLPQYWSLPASTEQYHGCFFYITPNFPETCHEAFCCCRQHGKLVKRPRYCRSFATDMTLSTLLTAERNAVFDH